MNHNLKNNIIDSIKKLECKPRWYFDVKNGLWWALGILTTLIGAVAVATIIFVLINRELLPMQVIGQRAMAFLSIFPYVWVGFLAILIVLGEIGVRQTRLGYRYPSFKILAVQVLVSIILGIILFFVKIGYYVDHVARQALPRHYQAVTRQELKHWHHPQSGFLVGQIIEQQDDKSVTLLDPSLKIWQVVLVSDHEPSEKLFVPGERVKVVGYQLDQNTFNACRVISFVLRGGPKRPDWQKIESEIGELSVDSKSDERIKSYLRNSKCEPAGTPYENN